MGTTLATSSLRLLLGVFAIIAASGQSASQSPSQYEELSQQAHESQSRADYRAAEGYYREILKLRPNLAEAHANLGLMQHLNGEYGDAIKSFQAALRINPRLAAANLFLGLDLLRLQRPAEAIVPLEAAQRLDPGDVQPQVALGQAYAALREYDKANSWYLRATETAPANGDAWYGLGVTHLSLVRAAAEQLGKISKGSFHSRLLLAESLDQRGWNDDAIVAYKKMLETDGPLPGLQSALGFSYLFRRDSSHISDAQKEFQSELSAHPGWLPARLGLARVAIEQGNLSRGIEELGNAWRVDRNFVRVNAIRLWQGFTPERMEDLQNGLRQRPTTQADPEMIDFLLTAIGRWRQTSSEEPIWTTDAAQAVTSEEEVLPKESQAVAALFSQGHYTLCARVLKPRLATYCFLRNALTTQAIRQLHFAPASGSSSKVPPTPGPCIGGPRRVKSWRCEL